MPVQLPIWGTVADVFGFIGRNWGRLIRIMAPAFALCAVILAACVAIDWQETGLGQPGKAAWLTRAGSLRLIAYGLCFLPAATNIHRLRLSGPDGDRGFAYAQPEWTYYKRCWQLGLLAFATFIVVGIVTGIAATEAAKVLTALAAIHMPSDSVIGVMLGNDVTVYSVVAIVWLLVGRFVMVLPSAALGEPMSFENSQTLMNGNLLRAGGAGFLVYLPWIVIIHLIAPWKVSVDPTTHRLVLPTHGLVLWLGAAADLVVQAIGVVLFPLLLSSIYRRLSPQRGEAEAQRR